MNKAMIINRVKRAVIYMERLHNLSELYKHEDRKLIGLIGDYGADDQSYIIDTVYGQGDFNREGAFNAVKEYLECT